MDRRPDKGKSRMEKHKTHREKNGQKRSTREGGEVVMYFIQTDGEQGNKNTTTQGPE